MSVLTLDRRERLVDAVLGVTDDVRAQLVTELDAARRVAHSPELAGALSAARLLLLTASPDELLAALPQLDDLDRGELAAQLHELRWLALKAGDRRAEAVVVMADLLLAEC